MAIKVIRNEQGNCIQFEGTTLPVYWNACLSARITASNPNNIDVVNDIETGQTGKEKMEISNEPYTSFIDKDGNTFATAQEAVDYITNNANVTGITGNGVDLNGVIVDFKLDNTSTSIMLDNGYTYGVNTIKAIAHSDGTIHIVSEQGDLDYFINLDSGSVTIGGVAVSGGLNDIVNTLNELFTVGAFEAVVIADPHSTIVADVGGVDTTGGIVGNAINPSGTDIGAGVQAHYNAAGYKSTETIDQAGEYFTFNMRNEGIFGACLVLNDIADAQGNLTYADPTKFCDGVTNTGNMGIQWGMFFHPSPNGPWTYYGALTGTVYGSGWNGVDAFRYSNDGANWLNGDAEEFRIGIDANSYISMEYFDNDTSLWVVVSRTNYPVGNNVEFHLGIKFCDSVVRLVDNPKVHLLEVDDSPTAIDDTNITLLGDALGTLNDGIATASGTNTDNGFITEEGLDSSGEYFEFEVNLGSNHTVSLVDADTHLVSTITADTSDDLINTYSYFGQGINNLGAVTLSHHNWSGLPATVGNRFAASHFRIGFDNQGKLTVWSSTDGANFIVSKHLSSSAINGDYRLMYIGRDAGATFESLLKGQLSQAPTMYFRYIESPDNNFEYPLFATEEEAKYYHEITTGVSEGVTHTHTYVDDPTNTTWFMPDNGQMTGVGAPYSMVFNGQTALFTEITSLTNSDLSPDAFSFSDISQEEGTVVSLQLYPAGATFSQSATISPNTSGLVYNTTTHYLQGTLTDVGADTVYTVTVTRANAYGSTVATFTVTATDVPVTSSLTTPWSKAVVLNGANEYLHQVSNSNSFNIINMGGMNNDVWGATNGKTSTDTDARPWSICQVVYIDNSQPQCYFSQGENVSNDRISLSTHETGAGSKIEFYWGRSTGTNGANSNGCQFLFDKPADGWYGYYIDTTGFRPNQAQSNTTDLAANFRFKQVDLSTGTVTDITGTWALVGDGRLNRSLNGDFYVGRESDSSFNTNHSLKVAATLVSTLKRDFLLPDDTEISMQVRDPQQWVIDYRDGTQQRLAYNNTPYSFDTYPERCVSLWLMGDGSLDSYSNNVRNDVKTADQNYTMLRLQNMVSNDIETVSISGLS